MSSPFQLDENSLMKSRLCTIFSPSKTPGNVDLFHFSEFINSKMISNGMRLNKIGRFEPSDINSYSALKNTKTGQDFSFSKRQSYLKNSYDPDIQMNFNDELLFSETKNFFPFPKETKLLNYNNNFNEEVKISKIKSSIMTNNSYGISQNEFTKAKRKRFITTNKPKNAKNINLIHSFDYEEEKENKFKIEANKMTKRLIEENLLNKNNNNSFFTKLSNNNNNINNELLNNNFNENNKNDLKTNSLKKYIYFEDIKASTINYQYLFEQFSTELDSSFNFGDTEVISDYKNNHLDHLHSEKDFSFSFGEDPLESFKGWLVWLHQENEKDKTKQSKQFCDDIVKTLNSISNIMSSFPIFIFPGKQLSHNLSGFFGKGKKKNREDGEENSSDKKFFCDFCNETFTSGQGLGGHMSRKHKDQSLKFKHKREIRNKREPLRKILLQAKKILCKNHLLDFEEQIKSKSGKKLIKKLIFEFNEEYKKIRNELKRSFINTINTDSMSINTDKN